MKIARSLFLLMPWVLSCAANPPDSSTTRNLQYKKENNRVIVKFKDNKSYNDFKGLDEVKALEKQNAKVFMLSAQQVKEMELREDVVMVVKDHKVYPPKDEEGNPVQVLSESVPYGIDMVNALLVDDSTSSNIGMCVVDSGYDMPHIDLQQTDVTGTDGPGAPWGDDSCGHGTHVTGTIMALGGNDEGVVGVVRNGEMPLHVVRVFSGGWDGCSWSWSSDLVGAVQECVDAGSSVVNMSLGSSSYSSFEDASFQDMADDGLLMIAAAGNGSNSAYSYPASYDAIVSVACIDENQVVAYFSQYNDQVEVAGPGVNTLSTCPNGTYCTKSGTSMASPHVAGVAALVWSAFPQFTNYEVREAMQVTSTDLGSPGRDDYYGHGLVNAEALYAYLFDLSGPQPSTVPSVSIEPSSNPSSEPSAEPTLSDSPSSSVAPSSFPSTTSMPTESCSSGNFMELANTVGAVKLEPLSSTDDTTQLLDLGFDFYWLGGTSSTSQVQVSSNGQININPGDTNNNCCGADGIGNYNFPRIAIAQEDLNPGDYGDIWVKNVSSDSIVISFEGVAFYSFTGSVNAQATLYSDGSVIICYGEGDLGRRRLTTEDEIKKKKAKTKYGDILDVEPDYHYDYKYNDYNYDYKYGDYSYGQTFAAGIEGGENDDLFPIGPAMVHPLPSSIFGSDGITSSWPTDRCYCFNPVTHVWDDPGEPTDAPTSSMNPSSSPSDIPTMLPSLSSAPSDLPSSSNSPSSSPSEMPTSSAAPSSLPSTSSMPTETCTSGNFMGLANTIGAVKLEPLSSYDDATQLLDLGFDFYWLGGASSTSQVQVSSNGQININPGDTNNNCCGADGIGNYNSPRIAIAQEDLNPSYTGDIWVKNESSDSIIVSFEGIPFYYSTGTVNAQATLSRNGGVTICYGEGDLGRRRLTTEDEIKKKNAKAKHGDIPDVEPDYHYDYKYNYDYNYDYKYGDYSYGQTFAAGIEGGENDDLFPIGPAMAYPLPSSHFDSNGITSSWPLERCYCFNPVTHVWDDPGDPTDAPTSSMNPSSSPSVIPTMSPSLSSAPSDLPSSSPSEMPSLSVTPSEVPTFTAEPSAIPSTSPSLPPPCFDSTLNSAIGNGNFNCAVVAANPDLADEMCALPAVASHCPVSCDTCLMYACADSTMPVSLNDRRVDCEFIVNRYDDSELALICQDERVSTTCRGTCETCLMRDYLLDFESSIVTLQPYYSDPASGLTFSNMYGMDALASGYGGTGYEYGTVSGSFSIYNGWFLPGAISCPGGSFTLKEVYITPAWTNYITYIFTGTKSNGSTVTKVLTLGTTTSAVLYTDWPDFTDLVDVDFALSGSGSQLVIDDLVVQFSSPCNGATDIVEPPINDGLNSADPPQ